jgi:hypothetical protein
MATAGRGHRAADRLVVVVSVRYLLAPPGDQQQRVVDCHAEADEPDQELDHEVDVHQVRQAQDGKERGRDRGCRDQQRHHGKQRGEDEGQYRERT